MLEILNSKINKFLKEDMHIFKPFIVIFAFSMVSLYPVSLLAEEAILIEEPQQQEPIEEKPLKEDLIESQEDMINSLVLVDESVNQVLDLLQQLTGKSILRQQDLPKVRINLNSNGSISKRDAILALESLLSMNGVAIVEMGNAFLKAVPAAGVQTQSPKMLTDTSLNRDPSQKIYSKIYKLKYLSAQEGIQAIATIATKNASSQVPLVKSNGILVVDTLMNLQRIEHLFAELDQPLALQEDLLFYPLKFVGASDVKAQIDAMKKGNLKKYLESTTVEADKNSNQLIVLVHAQNKHIIDQLIDRLDVDVQPLNKTEVFRLKYAESVEVATLIKSVVKGIPMPKRESGDARVQLLEKLRETSTAKTGAPPAEKGQQFSEALTLEPDERSNAIVVYGSPKDLELVRGLIEKIDVLLAQVQIEVIIAEVVLDDDQVSGLQSFDLNYNVKPADAFVPQGKLSYRADTPTTGDLIKVATVLSGSFNAFALKDFFKIAKQRQNVTILSAPMIVTTHNRKAIAKVVLDQPIISEAITSTTNNTNLNQTTKYLNDIGIVLEVTPRIGTDGIIQMEIKQTVKRLGPNQVLATSTTGTINAPQIFNREAESFVSVKDQEVIVLAGLQQRQSTTVKGKIWLLGCLPVLGDLLFSPAADTEQTTEIVMFIRPHVMGNMDEVREVTCDAMDRNIVTNEQVDRYVEYGRFDNNDVALPPWNCGLGTVNGFFSDCGNCPLPCAPCPSPCAPCTDPCTICPDPCAVSTSQKPLKKRKHPCRPDEWKE